MPISPCLHRFGCSSYREGRVRYYRSCLRKKPPFRVGCKRETRTHFWSWWVRQIDACNEIGGDYGRILGSCNGSSRNWSKGREVTRFSKAPCTRPPRQASGLRALESETAAVWDHERRSARRGDISSHEFEVHSRMLQGRSSPIAIGCCTSGRR